MRIQLPLERWLDILDEDDDRAGLREELVHKANQIGDSQFNAITQAWLHRYSKNVQLGNLFIERSVVRSEEGKLIKQALVHRVEMDYGAMDFEAFSETLEQLSLDPMSPEAQSLFQGFMRQNLRPKRVELPLPKVPMPNNITGFDWWEISFLDDAVLELFRKMSRLFDKVRLMLPQNEEHVKQAARQSLPHLMPLFASLESVSLSDGYESFTLLFNQFRDKLFGAKVLKLLRFDGPTPIQMDQCYDWLTAPRDDGTPPMLILNVNDLGSIVEDIKGRFLSSKQAATFFIHIKYYAPSHIMEEEILENRDTGEQLIIRNIPNEERAGHGEGDHPHGCMCQAHEGFERLLIIRCAINVDQEWLKKKRLWASKWEDTGCCGCNILVKPVENLIGQQTQTVDNKSSESEAETGSTDDNTPPESGAESTDDNTPPPKTAEAGGSTKRGDGHKKCSVM